jgi:hypothetical protein
MSYSYSTYTSMTLSLDSSIFILFIYLTSFTSYFYVRLKRNLSYHWKLYTHFGILYNSHISHKFTIMNKISVNLVPIHVLSFILSLYQYSRTYANLLSCYNHRIYFRFLGYTPYTVISQPLSAFVTFLTQVQIMCFK